jgi:predicted DNA-binding transcriptional regulator AlpA
MSDTPAPKVDPPDTYDEYFTELDVRSATMRDRFGLLSEGDLSALLGVDPLTLTAWRKKNIGPAVAKLGRGVFYRRADVDAWIAQNVAPMKPVL